jgi:uroporphyrinogen-III decarboxylase
MTPTESEIVHSVTEAKAHLNELLNSLPAAVTPAAVLVGSHRKREYAVIRAEMYDHPDVRQAMYQAYVETTPAYAEIRKNRFSPGAYVTYSAE